MKILDDGQKEKRHLYRITHHILEKHGSTTLKLAAGAYIMSVIHEIFNGEVKTILLVFENWGLKECDREFLVLDSYELVGAESYEDFNQRHAYVGTPQMPYAHTLHHVFEIIDIDCDDDDEEDFDENDPKWKFGYGDTKNE